MTQAPTLESVVCDLGDDHWLYTCFLTPSLDATPLKIGVCGTLDVSYSMDSRAVLAERPDAAPTFLSLMRAIFSAVIDTLPEGIEFRFASFADEAKIEFETDSLTDANRSDAKRALDGVRTRGSTNLWSAAKMGFECVKTAKKINVVLTDGAPNIRPPEGEYAEVLKRLDLPGGSDTTLIIVAIANSELDLAMMHKMASATGGYLIYVNDASMGATCLINAMATVCTLADANVRATVAGPETMQLVGPPSQVVSGGADLRCVNLGPLTLGSYLAISIRVPKNGALEPPDVTFAVGSAVSRCNGLLADDDRALERCVNEYARNHLCEVLEEGLELAQKPRRQPEVKPLFETTAERLTRLAAKYDKGSGVIDHLLSDLDGQLMMGAEVDKLKTWGKGAIYAALNAHYHRICVNFKDPGIQMYQTSASDEIRARAALKFREPQPVPPANTGIHMGALRAAPAPAVDWSAYMNDSGGCLHPTTIVRLDGGGSCAIEDVSPGTRLQDGASVRHVIKTRQPGTGTAFVRVADGVVLTPTHPVRRDQGDWSWPRQLAPVAEEAVEFVYNLVLEDGGVDFAVGDGSLRAVALGHGLKGPVVEHDFYGDMARVLEHYKLTGVSPSVCLA